MTDKSDIEALASAIYATANQFDAHRGELPAGYEDWADEIARDLRAHVEAARRLQPARVPDGWVSPFGSCICNGMNQCPGCNPNEAIKMAAGIAAADERAKNPPCMECGARTAKEAETMCHCSGDKDDCHGCQLWPDGDATPQPEVALSPDSPKSYPDGDYACICSRCGAQFVGSKRQTVCRGCPMPEAAQTAGQAEWLRPMETAPSTGIFRLVVEGRSGEHRFFAAEASFDSRNNGARHWMITTGWAGWTRLHSGWNPIGWLPMTPEPAPSAPADVRDELNRLADRVGTILGAEMDDGEALREVQRDLRRLSGEQQAGGGMGGDA